MASGWRQSIPRIGETRRNPYNIRFPCHLVSIINIVIICNGVCKKRWSVTVSLNERDTHPTQLTVLPPGGGGRDRGNGCICFAWCVHPMYVCCHLSHIFTPSPGFLIIRTALYTIHTCIVDPVVVPPAAPHNLGNVYEDQDANGCSRSAGSRWSLIEIEIEIETVCCCWLNANTETATNMRSLIR